MSTYLTELSLNTIFDHICMYMEANSLKVELRTSLCLSHNIIFHIGPHPWLVSGLLSSHIYGTYCNVYTVQCNVSTDSSLFV